MESNNPRANYGIHIQSNAPKNYLIPTAPSPIAKYGINSKSSSPDVPGRPLVYREDVELTYDPKTGKWVKSSKPKDPLDLLPNIKKLAEANKNKEKSKEASKGKSKVKSKEKADKEFIEQEFNTLTGDLSVTPSERSMVIRINETVRISGIGRYLSGNYYVTSVKRTIDKDSGYSHSITVLRNGFGDSLKKAYTSSAPNPPTETRKEEVPKASPSAEVGDTVKIVGKDAIYSNAHDGVKVPAWVKEKNLTIKQVSSDGSRVLLMPINSWTYVRYIQKV